MRYEIASPLTSEMSRSRNDAMRSINKISNFIRKERLYVLLAIFIITINVMLALPSPVYKAKRIRPPAAARDELLLKREELQKAFSDDGHLALTFTLVFLLILALLLLGILLDIVLLVNKMAGGHIDIRTYDMKDVRWNIWDVCRVAILFLFFGYIISIIESLLAKTFPIMKNDNFRMAVNSSILDTLAVVFILCFTVRQYGQKLSSLGISLKNFFKNVFYGIAGYITALPLLAALLLLTAALAHLFKYVPEIQPIVELFMKEKSEGLLVYVSIFAGIVGPIFEELFFRAFMYNAFKRYIGILGAALVTAAVFAVLHAHPVGFLPIMVLGILLAYLYEKTGTLVAPVTVHVIHNFSMVLFMFLIRGLKV